MAGWPGAGQRPRVPSARTTVGRAYLWSCRDTAGGPPLGKSGTVHVSLLPGAWLSGLGYGEVVTGGKPLSLSFQCKKTQKEDVTTQRVLGPVIVGGGRAGAAGLRVSVA